MASDLASFFQSLGARNMGNGEWLFPTCPYCDGVDKIYFNANKLVGICQKEGRTIYLSMIARDIAGVPLQQIQSYIDEHAASERSTLGFREAVIQGLLGSGNEQRETGLAEIDLPKEYRSLRDGQDSVIGRKAIEYMAGRGFDIDTLFRMGFGYCDSGKYENRVIVPFWEDGRLVYWQARDFTGKKPIEEKVLNPASYMCSQGKSDVLFNYDDARDGQWIILTESWGSALATGKYAVGINGKSLSDKQRIKLLAAQAHTIIVLLDFGADEEAWAIAHKLYTAKRTLIASLPYGDPNEVPAQIRNKAIRDAILYSREDHIRQAVKKEWKIGSHLSNTIYVN